MAEYPSNFRYQSSDRTLHWDAVEGAEEYQIEFTPDPQQVDWDIVYSGGNDTSCSFVQTSGRYAVKGRARRKGGWGIYGPIEYVDVVEP